MQQVAPNETNSYGTLEPPAKIEADFQPLFRHKPLSATSRLVFLVVSIVVILVAGYFIEIHHAKNDPNHQLVKPGQLGKYWPIAATLTTDESTETSIGQDIIVELNVQHKYLEYKLENYKVGIQARTFNGRPLGPTIHVHPGDTLALLVHNNLEDNGEVPGDWNTLRLPNSTSMHAHGLHVSPVGYADNVIAAVEPGQSRWYNYTIQHDHPRGLFWIHPHLHGSAALQVAYTMVCPLVVHENDAEIEETILSQVDADEVLVVQDLNLGSGKSIDYQVLTSKSQSKMRNWSMEALDNKSVTKTGSLNTLLSNAVVNPTIVVKDMNGKDGIFLSRVRILNAAIDGIMVINMRTLAGQHKRRKSTHKGEEVYGCDLFQIGSDGVGFSNPRRKAAVVVPAGGRSEILVRCPGFLVGSRIQIQTGFSQEDVSDFVGSGTNILTGNIAVLELYGKKIRTGKKNHQDMIQVHPHEFEMNKLPTSSLYHTTDLRDVPNDKVQKFVFRWTSGGKNTPKQYSKDGVPYTYYGVNDKQFNTEPVLSAKLGVVQEWTIITDYNMDGTLATESHPFHLHTNHFQIIRVSKESPDYQIGDWRDTITSPAPGNVTIRWLPTDYTGLSLAHCHTLVHEDTGMMIAFEIV